MGLQELGGSPGSPRCVDADLGLPRGRRAQGLLEELQLCLHHPQAPVESLRAGHDEVVAVGTPRVLVTVGVLVPVGVLLSSGGLCPVSHCGDGKES